VDGIEFRLLGPLELVIAGESVAVGPIKRRVVLAALLADIGTPVTLETLSSRVWDRTPPAARNILYAHISRIRSLLDASGTSVQLARQSGGYVLQADRGAIDVLQFTDLLTASHRPDIDDETRVDLLQEALGLWRATPLADLDGAWVTRTRREWEQQRITAATEWAQAAIRLGRLSMVTTGLNSLLTQYPMVEPLVRELMRALHAAGRSAEALELFARTRKTLVDELGVEPGTELRELHLAILRSTADQLAPGVHLVRPYIAPAQLPAYVPDFVGRAPQLAWLDELLASGQARTLVISGMAGVGKTSLAVHWAQRVREHFPDGQLYVNLRGYTSHAPVRSEEALAQFLRALGVPARDVPRNPEEAAGLFRSLLTDKRVLVLLDNAATAEQVRPLLPASPGCLVLVTSRNRLRGLVAREGALALSLGVLSPAEARALLAGVVGGAGADRASKALDELAAACGHLPLALRVAAASLSDWPEQRLPGYISSLTAGDRLATLLIDGDHQSAIRGAFDMSFQALPAEARQLFCLAGSMPLAELTAEAAAALTDATAARTVQMLDQLTTTHMMQERSPGRYAFHDLLRLYARKQAELETAEEVRRAAWHRLCGRYLATVDRAAQLLYPQLPRLPLPAGSTGLPLLLLTDHRGAVSWLDSERDNLVAITREAAEHGPHRSAWLIAGALCGCLRLRRPMRDWFAIATAGLRAAVADDDPAGQASAHQSLAHACRGASQLAEGVDHLFEARTLAEAGDWPEGHTAIVGDLGLLYADLGRMDQAEDHHARALAASRQAGNAAGRAVNLHHLGDVYRQTGDLGRAARQLTAAVALFEEIGSPSGQAGALTSLGGVNRELGRLDLARDELVRALTLHRELGDHCGEAITLVELSGVHEAADELDEATTTAIAAADLAEGVADRRLVAATRVALASAEARFGWSRQAIAHYEQARTIATAGGAPYQAAMALLGLARTHRTIIEPEPAARHATDGLEIARRAGYRRLERAARDLLAKLMPSPRSAPALAARNGAHLVHPH
jgi:DNA-binding SARP family transcriptional activator